MWFLIVTVYLGAQSTKSPLSMAVVQGFQTEQACRYAGAQQELALRTDFQLNTSKYYTFVCVPK